VAVVFHIASWKIGQLALACEKVISRSCTYCCYCCYGWFMCDDPIVVLEAIFSWWSM